MNKQTVVIATNNNHKLVEIKSLLKDFPFDIKSLKDVGLEGIEIIEDGNSFEENATIKAETIMKRTGFISIADDSGLEVDAINGAPGIYSARFAGENASDEENNDKLLGMLKNIPENHRTARFVSAVAMVFPYSETIVARGICEGMVTFEPRGSGGFGYDPLFMVPEYNLTFAEIDAEMKNKISHRARALERLKQLLKVYLQEV